MDDEDLDTLEALADELARLTRRVERLERQMRDEGLTDEDELDDAEL